MTFRKLTVPFLAVGMLGLLMSGVAAGQHRETYAQQAQNQQAITALRARIGMAQARVASARKNHKITRSRAITLRRQIVQARQSMTRVSARQGFISAAELASYSRTLATIDKELDRRGVERSYGNDMLPARQ